MRKIQTIRQGRIAGGDVYDVSDIIDKTLFPKYTVDVYSNTPDKGGKKIGVIKGGNPAGTVYSWVQDSVTKKIWWQFQGAGSFYYIEHAAGRFDVSNLKQQGVLTVAEKIEVEKKKEQEQNQADRPWYEKLGEGVSDTLKTGLWIVGGAIVLGAILKNK
jgi:hypothetical protein